MYEPSTLKLPQNPFRAVRPEGWWRVEVGDTGWLARRRNSLPDLSTTKLASPPCSLASSFPIASCSLVVTELTARTGERTVSLTPFQAAAGPTRSTRYFLFRSEESTRRPNPATCAANGRNFLMTRLFPTPSSIRSQRPGTSRPPPRPLRPQSFHVLSSLRHQGG